MTFRCSLRKCLLVLCLSCAFVLIETRPATFENGTSYIFSDDSGTITILDPDTGDEIAQGSASDGAGHGMDLPATLWIVFAFLLGAPLLLAGVRLGRLTSGVGLGLGLAVSLWASIINTVSEGDIADIIIQVITDVLFVIGFILGVITVEYRVGAAALGTAGGMSIMMRLIIMKERLLVPVYYVDWLLIALFGAIGLGLVVWRERWGVIIGSSSAGSFLICLGVDLLISKQAGISRGLRFMFDRNANHLADIFGTGYTPLLSTQIIMAITIAIIPIFAYTQHKLFPGPFRSTSGHRPSSYLGDDASVRSRTWIGRIRGRRHPAPPRSPVDADKDVFASTQSLVANTDSSDVMLHAPGTPVPYKDEPKEEEKEGGATSAGPAVTYTAR